MTDVRQSVAGTLRRLKRPEYTGENRCLPCTVLNTAIAGLVGVGMSFYWIPAGVAAFVLGLVVIFFRGYLVPGTPTVVRYFPEWVHAALGTEHHPEPVNSSLDIEQTLKDADIVRECPETADLCLTDDYRSAWRAQMAELDDEDQQRYRLSDSLTVPANEVTFTESESGWYVYVDGVRAGRWQSRAAFVADLASERLLGSRLDRWDTLAPDDRTQLLVSLRSFIEACPTCGGEVVGDEEIARSCCRDDIVSMTTVCADCDAVLFEATKS